MKTSQSNDSVLVVFGKDFPASILSRKFDTIVANKIFQKRVEALGCQFVELGTLVESGSIYEASAFAEELSRLTLPDGSRISKSFIYKDYELWWIHYNNIYTYFCLSYTQYRKLLEYLKGFQSISFYRPTYGNLFSCYLNAYGCKFNILHKPKLIFFNFLPLGIFLQILITLLSIPVLMVRKRRTMLFTGDKLEKSKDYDSRMKFVYKELRERNISFVEFIRSLESWKTVLKHAINRKRPVIYSEAVAFIGRFISVVSGGRRRASRRFSIHAFASQTDPCERFKLLVATRYLLTVYDDMWAIRIMKLILRMIGIKATLITAATERSYHAILGCKLNEIPTVGILHGIASRHYNGYDFLPGFDGTKMLSVDKYGLWSEWWREYYLKNSKAYRPEQLFVSGPMRPAQKPITNSNKSIPNDRQKINLLLISEIVAIPTEVMPYLDAINKIEDFSVHIKFRQHNDSFEKWLKVNRPDILSMLPEDRILKGSMQEAIESCDVVIGSQSTGVIEATLQLKPFILFNTKKWGDYFDMKSFDSKYNFFAENPEKLISHIKASNKIPDEVLKYLREKFFGDPHKDGSKWVVEQIEKVIKKK